MKKRIEKLEEGMSTVEIERIREEFIKWVQSFDYEISDSGHVSFGARAGAHDDYIIAVALAMFVATLGPFTFQYFGGSGANEKKRPSLLDLERELKKSS